MKALFARLTGPLILRRMSYLIVALLASAARADAIEETLDSAIFGKLTVYHAADEPKGVVLFASGTSGWNAELAAAAREIANLDYTVAGIDSNEYLARLDRSTAACADLSADLDQLNRSMEQRYPPATHLPPILLGQGAGAALGYAALVQASAERFHAGIAVDFCPELPLRKPVCRGVGNLEGAASPDRKNMSLKSIGRLPTTWFVFQNRPSCDAGTAAQFVRSIQLARLTEMADGEGGNSWLPQVSALLQWLDPSIVRQVQPDASVSGVPLTEVPATAGPDRPQFAIMFSGDGGWALLDRAVTAELAKNGLSSVGWDSLGYFWKPRQPDQVALDLERVLRKYMTDWKKERIVLIGYSFGADVLPITINRLPQDLRDRIDLTVFLGLSDYATFEFHLSDWISDEPAEGDQPVRPELAKLSGLKRLCIHGEEEEDASCPKLTDLGVIAEKMPGNHHFDEDYPGIARRVLEQLPPLPATTAPPPPTRN
ncbi:MAG: AcvB/VirJ family lysyl-phosphatidylglycerol hydrolase [Candidatus Competibacter sp.]|nr:AcvB/VirJ family lysyl-phosphatidylglycerol hydrolase [Candidatus Competibacter sp.]MDG4582874.1 AcvB/VirJ family lysyl-phosphatidylglycerol hydrolase [Candidatus Competibacter sp.]